MTGHGRLVGGVAPIEHAGRRVRWAGSVIGPQGLVEGATAFVLGVFVLVFVAYPIAKLVLGTMSTDPTSSGFLQTYREAFSSSVAWSAVYGTLWLTAVSLLFGVPLALLLAWITSSTDAPFSKPLSLLPILTLALSPLVGAIGWLVLLAPRAGIVNVVVRHAFGIEGDQGPFNAFSLPVIVALMTFYVVPYVYGPTHAAFKQLDSSLHEAARVCGARSVFWTVTFPLLRPALLAGVVIGGMMCASMFAVPLILSSRTGLHVIPTQIYQYINLEGRPGPATALASLFSLASIAALFLYFKLLGRARFITVSGKGSHRAPNTALGVWRWPATAVVILYLLVALVVPVGSLAYLSLVGVWSSSMFEQPLSLAQYQRLLNFPGAVQGLWNSTWLSGLASALAVLIGLIVSYRRLRQARVWNRTIAFIASVPLGIPSIVLGLAFLMTFTGGPLPLYGTAAILIIGYMVHVLPISIRNADAGLLQVSPELEEAGLVCGDTRAGVMRRILVPVLRRSLLAVWGLTFIILFRDLSMSILLYTHSTIPSSVALLTIFDQGWLSGAAAYSIIITLISALLVTFIVSMTASVEET